VWCVSTNGDGKAGVIAADVLAPNSDGKVLNPAACSEAGGSAAADMFVHNFDEKVLNTYSRQKLCQIMETLGVHVKKTAKKQTLVEEILNFNKDAATTAHSCDNMVEAHMWAKKAIKFAFNRASTGEFDNKAALWAEARITMGTSFSGIGTPEWAVRYIAAAGRAMQSGDPLPEFQLQFVLDREPSCRKARC